MPIRELPHVALSAHAHNREGLHRTDDRWLAEQWADPSTRVLVVSGTRVRAAQGRVHWLAPDQAPQEGLRVLLGRSDQVTRFAVLLPASTEEEGWLPLRGLFGALSDQEAGPREAPWLFHAVGLAEWHWSTRHCPRCGSTLRPRAAGHELLCTGCGKSQFPRLDPAVIMAVTHGERGTAQEQILLGRQATWPADRWSTLAGFCEPGETLEDAVRREVAEEVGITVGAVTYFGSQPWPLPASLMVGFVAEAVTTEIDVDGAEIAEARWFTREDLRSRLASGEIVVPGSVSISSSLLEDWYGSPLQGGW
ncbi:NAD(+) diphosphatase [Nocardioides houyundeii]|uniref:NAD(+) diphosphatase n=1 Tax=Nocardioides houyundeii TaxID=2045452 RepID=UPI001F071BC7|nr:NAD(+) diphosphatase [Nocardioides houyundeii]